MATRSVFAVIVAYNPSRVKLAELCRIVLQHADRIVVVDNTESPYISDAELPEGCLLVTLRSNEGIAEAQNRGIDIAMREGASLIVFFDQDSLVPPGLVSTLVDAMPAHGLAVLGPACYDDVTGDELPSVRLNRWGAPRAVFTGTGVEPVPADVIISSGTMASVEVFRVVGMMDSFLFIDGVDTDWCLRCRRHGIPIWVVPQARMHHRIGARSWRIGPFTLLVHSPDRCYYQVRNSVTFLGREHVPVMFALAELVGILGSRILLAFTGEGYSRKLAHGLWDGIATLLPTLKRMTNK